jgi:glutamate synthase (NADPH/NADH) large chain
VVLGDTGRNFAAGMSGGVAYVYDPFGKLPDNLNTELVEPEGLDDEDLEFLRGIVEKHGNETESPVAAAILDDWENTQRAFIKVMPRDYKRVLIAIADAEKAGRDVDEAIMEAARG